MCTCVCVLCVCVCVCVCVYCWTTLCTAGNPHKAHLGPSLLIISTQAETSYGCQIQVCLCVCIEVESAHVKVGYLCVGGCVCVCVLVSLCAYVVLYARAVKRNSLVHCGRADIVKALRGLPCTSHILNSFTVDVLVATVCGHAHTPHTHTPHTHHTQTHHTCTRTHTPHMHTHTHTHTPHMHTHTHARAQCVHTCILVSCNYLS